MLLFLALQVRELLGGIYAGFSLARVGLKKMLWQQNVAVSISPIIRVKLISMIVILHSIHSDDCNVTFVDAAVLSGDLSIPIANISRAFWKFAVHVFEILLKLILLACLGPGEVHLMF